MNCGTQSARVATSILKESNKIKKITKLNQLANKQTHQTRNKQTKETYSNKKCKNIQMQQMQETNKQINKLTINTQLNATISTCQSILTCSSQSIVT